MGRDPGAVGIENIVFLGTIRNRTLRRAAEDAVMDAAIWKKAYPYAPFFSLSEVDLLQVEKVDPHRLSGGTGIAIFDRREDCHVILH